MWWITARMVYDCSIRIIFQIHSSCVLSLQAFLSQDHLQWFEYMLSSCFLNLFQYSWKQNLGVRWYSRSSEVCSHVLCTPLYTLMRFTSCMFLSASFNLSVLCPDHSVHRLRGKALFSVCVETLGVSKSNLPSLLTNFGQEQTMDLGFSGMVTRASCSTTQVLSLGQFIVLLWFCLQNQWLKAHLIWVVFSCL